jgi:hypothetical protein
MLMRTELQEVLPDETTSPPRRNQKKLFLARLRTTSAEERLRHIIMERTRHLQIPNRIPRSKVAFVEK